MKIFKIAGAVVLTLIAADYLKAGGNLKKMCSVKTVDKMCKLKLWENGGDERFYENLPKENIEAKEKLKKDIEALYNLKKQEAKNILSSLSRTAFHKKKELLHKGILSNFLNKF